MNYAHHWPLEISCRISQSTGQNFAISTEEISINNLEQSENLSNPRIAEQELKRLQAWSDEHKTEGRLRVYYFRNHAKILLKDDEYIICGSFNWLSNSGGSYNQENSLIVYDKNTVTERAEKILDELNKLPPDRRGFLHKFFPWSDY